jgi:hypothetical protein
MIPDLRPTPSSSETLNTLRFDDIFVKLLPAFFKGVDHV